MVRAQMTLEVPAQMTTHPLREAKSDLHREQKPEKLEQQSQQSRAI